MSDSIVQFVRWPSYSADEIAAALRVLESGKVNYWTGTEGREFEKEYASHVGTRHAVAVANGTAALELALAVFDIGPGDEVITTPRTFIASASCAIMRGATPIFADVDRDTQNITASTIEKVMTKRTRAVIPVHLAGWPCEMDEIMDLARQNNLVVIEDCAQANGAALRGRPVGGIGDAGAFSFCQDKIITTAGEGGMLTISDETRWSRAWSYKDHGRNLELADGQGHPPGYRWIHDTFGTNWRLTEVQSAIGRVQLRKLSQTVQQRNANAAILLNGLSRIAGIRVPAPPPYVQHAYYKFYAFVEPAALRSGWDRDRIMAEIAAMGVPCFSGSCPEVYLEKAFESSRSRPSERLPIARELGETSLMFVVHPTLGAEQMHRTVDAAAIVMQRATK